jgi:hypothetical protein
VMPAFVVIGFIAAIVFIVCVPFVVSLFMACRTCAVLYAAALIGTA